MNSEVAAPHGFASRPKLVEGWFSVNLRFGYDSTVAQPSAHLCLLHTMCAGWHGLVQVVANMNQKTPYSGASCFLMNVFYR
jgi:hypothetical protein